MLYDVPCAGNSVTYLKQKHLSEGSLYPGEKHLCENCKKKKPEVIKLTKELLVCLSIFTQTNSFYNLIIFSLWCASIFDFCAKKVNTPSKLLPRTKWISLFLPNTTKGGLSRPRFNCLALMLTFCPGVNKNWGLSALIFTHGARLYFSLLCHSSQSSKVWDDPEM